MSAQDSRVTGKRAGAGDPLRLGRDPSTRFLPWMIGVMTYLAILAVAGGLASREIAHQWDGELARVLTVQIPHEAAGTSGKETGSIQEVLRVLRVTAGIGPVRVLPPEETKSLLAAWLEPDILAQLPLPMLIDVRLVPGAAMERKVLAQRLATIVPGVIVDDHRRWAREVGRIAGTVATLGVFLTLLVALAAVLAVGFAVRTGLAIHGEVIELLTLIGAQDGYIARRFQRHVFGRAVIGAIGASLLAVLTTGFLVWLGTDKIDPTSLPLSWIDLVILAMVPVLATLLAALAARRAVFSALARMA